MFKKSRGHIHCTGPSVLVYLTGAIIGLGGRGEIKHGLKRQHSMHLQLTSHLTSLRFLWNSATGWMFIYECLFICFYLNILRRIITLTKKLSIPLQWTLHQWRKYYFGFSYRKEKICISQQKSKLWLSEKHKNKKALGLVFLYIWWFSMHNEWQYIAINFLTALYIT